MTEELLAVADELYGTPLADFTAVRDGRAKEHRGTEFATRIKALRKPTTAAWVLDLLVRREAEQVDQLLSVGAALREAQEAMSAGELRELTKQRRQVTAAVAQQARRHALAEGVKVTSAVGDQVEATLTAAMVDAECGRALRSGMLVRPLTSNGVEPVAVDDLAVAVALPEALGHSATPQEAGVQRRPNLHVVPDPDAREKKLAAARERLEEAQASYDEAFSAHEAADDDFDRLHARELQIQSELDELRRRIDELEDHLEEVAEETNDAQQVLDEAAAALRTSAAERDAAAAEVAKYEEDS